MPSPDELPLRFSLSGPVRAWRGAEEVSLGPPQQRAVLAALLLGRGEPVPTDGLAGAVWGEDVPEAAGPVVRTYVSRLRGLLEPGRAKGEPPRVLVSVAEGYLLRTADASVDLTVFEERVRRAAALRARGAPREARDMLRAALDDWPGEPLAEIPGPLAARERARLTDLRLEVVEDCLGLDVELGGHARAVPALTGLIARHPLRERPRSLLMLALYRGGRRAEAEAVYDDVRHVLADRPGTGPWPALTELYERIRAADPGLLDTPAPTADAPSAPRVTPAQLPATLADFTGRQEEVDRLVTAMTAPSPATMPVAAVTGMGGVGKTALAVHVAHALTASYPDGQLHADLQGFDEEPVDPASVLAAFLRALGVREVPDGLDDRAALFRSLTVGRRLLVVLDNARDTAHVRPLLPGAGSCAVIVTSRSRLGSLPATERVRLEALDLPTAVSLLARIMRDSRTETQPLAVTRLVEMCGGLPLALRIIASRLAVRPDWHINDMLGQLTDERSRFADLRVDGLSVEACFAVGYRHLTPEAARAFRLLSLPAPAVLTLEEAAAVLGLSDDHAEDVLESLVDIGMLESPRRCHYAYHDLVRVYARARAVEETPPSERDEAVRRLLDFLLATSVHAYRVLRPGHTVPALLPPTGDAGLRFADADAAGAWGERRIGAALEVVRQAAGALPAVTADLLLALDPVLLAQHRWHDVAPVATAVADSAARQGDERAEERARYMQGGALMQCSDGRATEVIARAVRLSRSSPDASVRAMILNVAAILRGHEGRDEESVRLLREATRLASLVADESLEMLVLGNLAQTLLTQGVPAADVLDVTDRQWELCERLGDAPGRSDVLYRRGQALRRLGRPEEALDSHLRALSYGGDGQQLLFRAGNFVRAAEACLDLRRHGEATRHAEQGVALARELRHGPLEVLANKVLGDALTATGNPAWGRVCWEQALARAVSLRMTADIDALRERLDGRRRAPAAESPAG